MKQLVPLAVGLLLIGCNKDGPEKPSNDVVDTGGPGGDLPRVYINEFMASNATGLTDETGAHPDWIELHNTEQTSADISGWLLSDSCDNFHKFVIPDMPPLGPGEYIVFDEDDFNASLESPVQQSPL